MAKVDILNYISDSNILRSTYDTDTNELDITDVPQNLNSVITLGQGGGGVTVEELNVTANGTYTAPEGHAYSPVNVDVENDSYGNPYCLMLCGGNVETLHLNGQIALMYSVGVNKRVSIWKHDPDGTIPVYNFVSNSEYSTTNTEVQPIDKKDGSTSVKVTCDFTCQMTINEFKYENGTGTASTSGWLNITKDTPVTFNFLHNDYPYFIVAFRVNASDTAFDYSRYIQYVKIEME